MVSPHGTATVISGYLECPFFSRFGSDNNAAGVPFVAPIVVIAAEFGAYDRSGCVALPFCFVALGA